MEQRLLELFRDQVRLQCEFILFAAKEVNIARDEGNVTRMFYALQNLLNAAANISKVIWGTEGKLAAERKPVRDSIGISDTSPLKTMPSALR